MLIGIISIDFSNFNDSNVIPFALYAVFNFTLAHYLWNRANSKLTIPYTSIIVFSIPFVSTLVLSIFSDYEYDVTISLGLLLITLGIALMYRNRINAVGVTIASGIVIFLLLQVIPVIDITDRLSILTSSQQVLIAIFAIYWGFIFQRSQQEFDSIAINVDKIQAIKMSISNSDHILLLRINSLLKSDYNRETTIKNLSLYPVLRDNNELVGAYLSILRSTNKSISTSEKIVLLIIAILIISVSFISRADSLLDSVLSWSISTSIVSMLYVLYEQNKKKFSLLEREL
jgi:hypothetical protein